jgi:hypothetical protein
MMLDQMKGLVTFNLPEPSAVIDFLVDKSQFTRSFCKDRKTHPEWKIVAEFCSIVTTAIVDRDCRFSGCPSCRRSAFIV